MVIKNIKALEDSGQKLALDWLLNAPSFISITLEKEQNSQTIMIIDGRSQTSRLDPLREAKKYLELIFAKKSPNTGKNLLLFGIGNPLLAHLLLQNQDLAVYDPDPLSFLAAFSFNDFSTAFMQKKLTLFTPWHLAEDKIGQNYSLIEHLPSKRRAPAHFINLEKISKNSKRNLTNYSGKNLKIMLIPPISGGSLSVAKFLASAVEKSQHDLSFLDWGEEIRSLEKKTHLGSDLEINKLISSLFKKTAKKAEDEIVNFQAELIIILAQAPLDAEAILKLRKISPAVFVFWLVEDFEHFSYALQLAPAYDAFFHIQKGSIERTLRDNGLTDCYYLPLAADPSFFTALDKNSLKECFCVDLSFMGAGYPNRRQILSKLAKDFWPKSGKNKDKFKIFGSGWDGADTWLKKHLFQKGRRINSLECAQIYAGSLINLNIHSSFYSEPEFNPKSRFVNPRTFEIAAAGSFQIVDQRPLLGDLFSPELELKIVESPEELPYLLEYYFKNIDETQEIGRAARARVLREHCYHHRLESILAYLAWREEK